MSILPDQKLEVKVEGADDPPVVDFLVLVIILLGGFLGYLTVGFYRGWQMGWMGLTALGYVGWGVGHHLKAGNFHWEVVVEYLLIAGLATGLVVALLLG